MFRLVSVGSAPVRGRGGSSRLVPRLGGGCRVVVAVTEQMISPVVPPSDASAAARGRSRGGAARPLPLPELVPQAGKASLVYGMGRVDASGRVSGRSVIRALGWRRGDRLTVSVIAGTVVVRPDSHGVFTMTTAAYVVLPAAVRTLCGVDPGDQVLLVAAPEQGVLFVHTLPVLEENLSDLHASLRRGLS